MGSAEPTDALYAPIRLCRSAPLAARRTASGWWSSIGKLCFPIESQPCDLVLDPLGGPRDGFEAGLGDRLARDDADAVGPGLDAGERLVDLADGVLGLAGQREVPLTLDGDGVPLA